ncbi:MAG: tRNA (guanine6-N2)-methyltransferase [Candidatus Latescibacterota bacterium]|jgi:tRNA (guanine6-N2)-methyltransferase
MLDAMNNRDTTTAISSAQEKRADTEQAKLFITTNPGLEDVVKEELETLLETADMPPVDIRLKPFGFGGQVWVEGGQPQAMEEVALTLRSVHHVLAPLHRFEIPATDGLQYIEAQVEALDIAEMAAAQTFRVTSRRSGKHDFGSLDIQRRAGAALWRHYGCAVDLENFDVNLRVDVFENVCLVGYQLTQKSLSKRYKRRFQPRVALKASVAYAMLHFAHIKKGEDRRLLDPFCGSGTILFEAAQIFPQLSIHGCDIDHRVVDCARGNAEDLELAERIDLRQGDARELDKAFPDERFAYVITNPPYGVRFGQHLNFERFYTRILQQIWHILEPGGRLVLIAWKRRQFMRALKLTGLFHKDLMRPIETGDLHPCIYVLTRIDREEKT